MIDENYSIICHAYGITNCNWLSNELFIHVRKERTCPGRTCPELRRNPGNIQQTKIQVNTGIVRHSYTLIILKPSNHLILNCHANKIHIFILLKTYVTFTELLYLISTFRNIYTRICQGNNKRIIYSWYIVYIKWYIKSFTKYNVPTCKHCNNISGWLTSTMWAVTQLFSKRFLITYWLLTHAYRNTKNTSIHFQHVSIHYYSECMLMLWPNIFTYFPCIFSQLPTLTNLQRFIFWRGKRSKILISKKSIMFVAEQSWHLWQSVLPRGLQQHLKRLYTRTHAHTQSYQSYTLTQHNTHTSALNTCGKT